MKKIREGKDLKRNYLSSISAKFNPDLLIGQLFEDEDDNDDNIDKLGADESLYKVLKR